MVSADEPAAGTFDLEVIEEVVLLDAARVRKDAALQADQGRFDVAHGMLNDVVAEILRIAPGATRTVELMDEVSRLETHKAAMRESTYDPVNRKRMMTESWRRTRGRNS